jgi:hypothetical protein
VDIGFIHYDGCAPTTALPRSHPRDHQSEFINLQHLTAHSKITLVPTAATRGAPQIAFRSKILFRLPSTAYHQRYKCGPNVWPKNHNFLERYSQHFTLTVGHFWFERNVFKKRPAKPAFFQFRAHSKVQMFNRSINPPKVPRIALPPTSPTVLAALPRMPAPQQALVKTGNLRKPFLSR